MGRVLGEVVQSLGVWHLESQCSVAIALWPGGLREGQRAVPRRPNWAAPSSALPALGLDLKPQQALRSSPKQTVWPEAAGAVTAAAALFEPPSPTAPSACGLRTSEGLTWTIS